MNSNGRWSNNGNLIADGLTDPERDFDTIFELWLDLTIPYKTGLLDEEYGPTYNICSGHILSDVG